MNAVVFEYIAHDPLEQQSGIIYFGTGPSGHAPPGTAATLDFIVLRFCHFQYPPNNP